MEDTLLKMFNNTKTDLGNFGALTKQSYTSIDNGFNKVFEDVNKAFNTAYSAEKKYYRASPERNFEKNRFDIQKQQEKLNSIESYKESAKSHGIKEDLENTSPREKSYFLEVASASKTGNEPKIDIKTISANTAESESIKSAEKPVEIQSTKAGAAETVDAVNKSNTDETAKKSEAITNENTASTLEVTAEDRTSQTIISDKKAATQETSNQSTQITTQDRVIQIESIKTLQVTQEIIDKILPGESTVKSTVTTTAAPKSAVAQAPEAPAQNINMDFHNEILTKDLKTETSTSVNTPPTEKQPKLQAQTQQVLLNIKTTEQDPLPIKDTEQAPLAKTSEQLLAKVIDAPMIKATTDVVASSEFSQKPTMKAVMERLSLTQDMLDNIKAKVSSVELSSQSNNLLNQQNAQEQGAKLAFEGINNLLSQSDTSKSGALAKPLDSIQAPKDISKQELLSQIHTKMEPLKEEGVSKVTIVLKPENLGKVNLELINSKEGLIARMTTENAQVKELLEKSLESLKSSLGAQGVNVVSVKVESTSTTPEEMYSFDDGSQQNRKQESDSQTFEEKFGGTKEELTSDSQEQDTSNEADMRSPHAVDYKI